MKKDCELFSQIISVTDDDIEQGQVSRKELYYKLARMFNTLQLWVEEPLLHDGSLYLPSLPPQYQADRLLEIFNNQTVWQTFYCHNFSISL